MKRTKYVKTFENYTNETPEKNSFKIEIWGVPYDVTQNGNDFTMENCFGMDAIGYLKRKNPHNEPYGERAGNFGVYVDSEEKITITIFDKMADMYHDGNIIDALTEAIDIIETYYSDVGWEFLESPRD